MWLLCAFGSAVFAGITAIFAKIGLKDTDSTVDTAIRTIVILVFSWLLAWIGGSFQSISTISQKTLLFLILSGLATGASWLCYFRALKTGDVNQVTPIDKSSVILTMILAMIFLGEPISWLKLLCMVLIGTGTFMMIQKKEQNKEHQAKGKSWLIYAVLSAVFASLTAILGKVGIENIDSNLGTAIRTTVVLVMAWMMVFIMKKQNKLRDFDKRSLLFIVLSGLTTGLSWLCYYRALQTGYASIIVPIDKLSVVFTVGLSCIFLHEKLKKEAWLGLLLIMTGTLLLLI